MTRYRRRLLPIVFCVALSMAFSFDALARKAPELVKKGPVEHDPNDRWDSATPYEGVGFEWENNKLGLDDTVPAPWTPVEVGDDKRSATVWARTIAIGDDGLPARIVSRKRELLARPMRLVAQTTLSKRAGDKTGNDTAARLTSSGDCAATWQATRRLADLKVETATRIEFDGFVMVTMTVSPIGGKATIEKLILEAPLRREAARLFSMDYPYDFIKMQAAGRAEVEETAGRIEDDRAMGFNNHVWVGDDEIGLEISSDTNLHWSSADSNASIRIAPGGKTTLVQYRIVDKPMTIEGPVEYLFGFYVTPVKPQPKNWRARVISNYLAPEMEGLDKALWSFNTFRVGPTNFVIDLPHPGLPLPYEDPEKRRTTYTEPKERIKAQGVGFIPYSSLFGMHGTVPDFRVYYKRWLRNPEATGGTTHNAWASKMHGQLAPGKTGASYKVSLYSKSVQDFNCWVYAKTARDLGHAGLFYDHATPSRNVVNYPAAARVDVRGKEGVLYEPIFANRKYYQRLYKTTKSIDPDYLITLHTQKLPVFYGAYCDITYPGEAMNADFRRLGRRLKKEGKLPEGHPPYVPDHRIYPMDFWRACYGQRRGYQNFFFAQVVKGNKGWLKAHPEEFERWTRLVMARVLPCDLPLVSVRIETDILRNIHRGYQKHFGGLVDPIRFVGFWNRNEIVADTGKKSGLVVSAYARKEEGKAVLIVSNVTERTLTETLPVNFEGLDAGFGRIEKTTDIEGKRAFEHTGKAVTVTVPPNDFRLVLIE